jgi:alpha-1,2-glucosyltransferase
VYWFTFKNDHPYNQIATYYFIRNYILVKFTSSSALKVLFFLPMLYTIWSLVVTPLSKKSWNIFYLFTALFLLPGWLIEQRYYIIPFVLFMLFRKEQSPVVERMTVLYYAVILCLLIPAVVSLRFFL